MIDEYSTYASSTFPFVALSRALFPWSLHSLASTSFKANLLSVKCGAIPLARSVAAATRHSSINASGVATFPRLDPHCWFLALVLASLVNRIAPVVTLTTFMFTVAVAVRVRQDTLSDFFETALYSEPIEC